MKQFSWRTVLCAACLFPLFLSARMYGGQAGQSESGISENTSADTVHIPNSTRDKNVESVHIKNSKSNAPSDTTILLNSDENTMDREQAQNPNYISQTPIITSSPGRGVKSKGKIISGAALFGASYGFSLLLADIFLSTGTASSQDNSLGLCFLIPVVGPVAAYFTNQPSSDVATPVAMLCAGWSAAQGIGLALLISGLVGTPARPAVSAAPFSIEPLVMKDKVGLTFRMRFN